MNGPSAGAASCVRAAAGRRQRATLARARSQTGSAAGPTQQQLGRAATTRAAAAWSLLGQRQPLRPRRRRLRRGGGSSRRERRQQRQAGGRGRVADDPAWWWGECLRSRYKFYLLPSGPYPQISTWGRIGTLGEGGCSWVSKRESSKGFNKCNCCHCGCLDRRYGCCSALSSQYTQPLGQQGTAIPR